MTIYLGSSDDSYLESITHAGRTARPKLAASRSAVIRLALERLQDQLKPEEIIAELRSRGDNTGATGRKRR